MKLRNIEALVICIAAKYFNLSCYLCGYSDTENLHTLGKGIPLLTNLQFVRSE